MAFFSLSASVTVDVEMSINAQSPEAAEALFNDRISMTANLIDVGENDFFVNEDSISELDVSEVIEI